MTMKSVRSHVLVLGAVMLASLVWQGCEQNLNSLRRAAERGDAKAQHDLGAACYYGDGVPLDVTEGLRWLRKAAEQGDEDAQCWLGWAYSQGRVVPQDLVEAYMWANLASPEGSQRRAQLSAEIVKRMTSEQIAEGQRRVAEYVPKKAPSAAR